MMNMLTRVNVSQVVGIVVFLIFFIGSILVIRFQFSPHFILYGRLDTCQPDLPRSIEFHHIPIGRPITCEDMGTYGRVILSIANSFRERLPSSSYLAIQQNSKTWELIVVDPLSPPIQPYETLIIRNGKETREIRYLTKAFKLIIQNYHSRSIVSEQEWIESLEQSEPIQHLFRHNGKFMLSHSKMLSFEREQWKKACNALLEPDMARTHRGKKFVSMLFTLLQCGPLTIQSTGAGGPVASR